MSVHFNHSGAPGSAASPAADPRAAAGRRLLAGLRTLVRQDVPLRERVLSRHTTKGTLRTVLACRRALLSASARCRVPVACLETVLFREQRLVDWMDAAADILVQPLGLRAESSTGLMQIKGATAVAAIREAVEAGRIEPEALGFAADTLPAAGDPAAHAAVWRRLHSEPEFNILTAALVLLSCAEEAVQRLDFESFSEEELVRTFARYNGHGDAALAYGRACCRLHRAFQAFEAAEG